MLAHLDQRAGQPVASLEGASPATSRAHWYSASVSAKNRSSFLIIQRRLRGPLLPSERHYVSQSRLARQGDDGCLLADDVSCPIDYEA